MATRWPSGPSITIARADRRDCIPYDGVRRVECAPGSTPCSPTGVPSPAYCPADAPTCQLASTDAAPARTPSACATPAMAARLATANATAPATRLPLRIARRLYHERRRARADWPAPVRCGLCRFARLRLLAAARAAAARAAAARRRRTAAAVRATAACLRR